MANKVRIERRRQADRSETSDQRLAAAAVQLLVKRGVRGTTLAALGQESGYSRGLATHRFGSKAGLLRQVMQRASQRWLALLQANVGNCIGVAALCATVDAQLDFLRESPDEVRAMYLLWFTSIDPASQFRANVARVHQRQREDIVRWIKLAQADLLIDKNIDAVRFAEQFCANMFGIVYQWLVNANMPIVEMHQQIKVDTRTRLAPPRVVRARRSRTKPTGEQHERGLHI